MTRLEMIEQLSKQGVKLHPCNVQEEKPNDENCIYYLSTQELENLVNDNSGNMLPEEKTPDIIAARELQLFGMNNYRVYKNYLVPVCANMEKKVKKGVFDSIKAKKAFLNVANYAARIYCTEFGGVWYQVFNVATRKEFAAYLLEYFITSYDGNDFFWK